MKETIREFYELGIRVLPLGYKAGKFIHPNYSHKFDEGFTLEEALALCDAGYDKGVAVMHGKCNLYLCALDVDEKNAPGENLWEKIRHIMDPDVLRKILHESTRSDGTHGYFLCKTLPPQKALASSQSGEEWIAIRSAANNCITYCAPSPGYSIRNGAFADLQELTESEMMHVVDVCMQLNKYEGQKSKKGNNMPVLRMPADLAPYFREFDKKVPIDWVIEILERLGWTTDGNVKRKAFDGQTWEYMKYWRPGKDHREPASANLWLQSKRFSVFTTSTILPAFGGDQAFSHLPSGLLYHFSDRDWKAAYAQIRETADVQRIELPQAIPMAYSIISNNREVWRIDVKGIMDWAVRGGYQWMRMSVTADSSRILIRVIDNVIYETDTADLQRHYIEEVNRTYPDTGPNQVLYAFMPSIVKYMEALPVFDEPLIRDERDKSFIFFRNGVLRITKTTAELVKYTDIDGCVFSRHIKDFDYVPTTEHGVFGEFIDMVSIDTEHKRYIMTALGFILHYFKLRDYAKAVMIIEDVEDQEQARGRSGKGIIAQFVEWIRWTVQQDGRNYKSDSQFKMQQIVPGVQVFYLNDPAPTVLMNQFYNYITDDMLIEAKGKKSYTIPFRHSPKLLITTNYLPNLESDSDKDRFIVLAIKKTFSANFSVREAFPGQTFFDDDWGMDDRNGAVRFAVDCLQAYLSSGVVVYMNDDMRRNADQRVVRNLVAESIIEVMEKAVESAQMARSELQFLDMLAEIDLRAEQPESLKKAFGWRHGELVIYVSRFYQYCLRGPQLKNYTDKRFFKAINLYIDKMGLTRGTDSRSKNLGRYLSIKVAPFSEEASEKRRTEDEKGAPGSNWTPMEVDPF
jgi:hypothetical protein